MSGTKREGQQDVFKSPSTRFFFFFLLLHFTFRRCDTAACGCQELFQRVQHFFFFFK